MKKLLYVLSAAVLCTALLAGCDKGKGQDQGQAQSKPEVSLTVFAAASLTEALNEIAGLYKSAAPEVTLNFNFESSGTLQTQIENGADADLFISAGQKQMDALAGKFINDETRKNVLINKVVLIVPENSAKGISSFEDVLTDKVKLVALGNPSVPVGQYSEEIFTFLKSWDKVSKKASLGSNVKEVLSQVESGSVDCGVVYSTDAATAKSVKVAASAPEGSHKPVVYPAAVVKESKNADAALAYLGFLGSPDAAAVFTKIGFEVVK
ncbi:MAG: molybdate ABC transporter substrate-binding protein [Chitinispirillales bacterium]|jgi:molybdate transport system substrate-binding protein|nr:molybdate ABC transporter substrate-binding protein [Chitinispirillales bacterium]